MYLVICVTEMQIGLNPVMLLTLIRIGVQRDLKLRVRFLSMAII